MSQIYHDDDADLGILEDQVVALIGYGNQGRSQALNLRDSGVNVTIGNIRDRAAATATKDGFSVLSIAEACEQADVVMLLVPDEVMPEVFKTHVAPNLAPGNLIVFASGYNIAFNLIKAVTNSVSVGPILVGPAKPAHILTPSVTARGIVNLAALAAVDAQAQAR